MVADPGGSRAVEVLFDRDGTWDAGSGFLIGGGLVLAAAHNLTGHGKVYVRRITPDSQEKTKWAAEVVARGEPDEVDLALIRITDERAPRDWPWLSLAAVDRSGATSDLIACSAVGFPSFKKVAGSRDSAQLYGTIPVHENLYRGTLTFQLTRHPPEPLPPRGAPLGTSEWSGISGTVVLAGDLVVGVITEHHRPEGGSALTVTPITHISRLPASERRVWEQELGERWKHLVHLPVAGTDGLQTRWMSAGFRPVQASAVPGDTIELRLDIHSIAANDKYVTFQPALEDDREIPGLSTGLTISGRKGDGRSHTMVTISYRLEYHLRGGMTEHIKVMIIYRGEIVAEPQVAIRVASVLAASVKVIGTRMITLLSAGHVNAEIRNIGSLDLTPEVQIAPQDGGEAFAAASVAATPISPGETCTVQIPVRPKSGYRYPALFSEFARLRLFTLANGKPVAPPEPVSVRVRSLTRSFQPALLLAALLILVSLLLSGTGNDSRAPQDGESRTIPIAADPPPQPAVDMIRYDQDSSQSARIPILLDREGHETRLPAGPPVKVAVKIPGGWLVIRRHATDADVPANSRQTVEVLGTRHLRVSGHTLRAWVDESGTRLLIDRREPSKGGKSTQRRQDGVVEIYDLTTGARKVVQLPGTVDVVDWIGSPTGDRLLLMVGCDPDLKEARFDYWKPEEAYRCTPGESGGELLGQGRTAASIIAQITHDGHHCVAELAVDDGFRILREGCDLPQVDFEKTGFMDTSPDGQFVVLPGRDGGVSVARFNELVTDGRAVLLPTKIDGKAVDLRATDLEWIDDQHFAVLVEAAPYIWTCAAADGACKATQTTAPPDQLVSRVSGT